MNRISFLILVIFYACDSKQTSLPDDVDSSNQTEYINSNVYFGMAMVERRPWEVDSIKNYSNKFISIIDLRRHLDSLKRLDSIHGSPLVKPQHSEVIEMPISPYAYLMAMDTSGAILEYSYFYNEPDTHDEEHAKYVYLIIPSPSTIRMGKVYTLPGEDFIVSAWKWRAWTGIVKCHNVSGTVSFSKFSPDSVIADLMIKDENSVDDYLVCSEFTFRPKDLAMSVTPP